MPRVLKYAIWAAVIVVAVRFISADPSGAGHSVGKIFADIWTFFASI